MFAIKPPHVTLNVTLIYRAALMFAALGLSLGLSGCSSGSSPRTGSQDTARDEVKPQHDQPDARVYVDEAQLQKPFAILTGTVENSGSESLENLQVVLELRPRNGGPKESREVSVEPGALAPGEKGRFSLKVKSEEWAGFTVIRLSSPGRPDEIAFQPLPGKPRPPERVDSTRTVTEERPRSPSSPGEDFINTPDTAIPIP